jgi:hypothetical protein
MHSPVAPQPVSPKPVRLDPLGSSEVPQVSDNVGANGWKLVLMALAVLAAMAALTAALVYLGPLVGL